MFDEILASKNLTFNPPPPALCLLPSTVSGAGGLNDS